MPFRAVFFLYAFCVCIDAQVAPGSFLLSDNFTEDTSLNQDLWRVNAPLVGAIAGGLQLVTPQLAFSNMGMTVTGVSAIRQFAGIQSAQAFTPPFTMRATVKGVVAHANPFALYLVAAGNSQSLRITGNLNPGNAPAYKTSVALKGQPAQTLDSNPSVNKWYMLTIAVGPRGNATVTEVDQAGNVIGRAGPLAFGMTPAFVVLAQSEPNPRTVGPNEAIWRQITVVSGRTPENTPPSLETRSATPEQPAAAGSSQANTASSRAKGRIADALSAKEIFDQSTAPAWHALMDPVAGFDLNGTWQMDGDAPGMIQDNLQKISIYQLRDSILITNLGGRQYFPRGAEILYGTYSATASISSRIKVLDAYGDFVLHETTVNVKDGDHIQLPAVVSQTGGSLGKSGFHRISTTTVDDVACDPRNPLHISGQEANVRGDIYVRLNAPAIATCWKYVGAMQGHALAQAGYGYSLSVGRGIARDRRQALTWFQKSAIQGEPFGEANLGIMFRDGIAAPKSTQRSAYWIHRSNMKDPNVVHDGRHNPIQDWARQTSEPCDAANPSHIDANGALSRGRVAYQARVLEIAVCWFEISAAQGNAKANVYLGILNTFGLGVPGNPVAGFAAMDKGAKAGDPFGMVYLANFYRYGIGTAADDNHGREVMAKALNAPGGQDAFMRVQGTLLNDKQALGMVADLVARSTAENNCHSNNEEYERTGRGPGITDCPDAGGLIFRDAKNQIHHTIDTPEEIFPEVPAW